MARDTATATNQINFGSNASIDSMTVWSFGAWYNFATFSSELQIINKFSAPNLGNFFIYQKSNGQIEMTQRNLTLQSLSQWDAAGNGLSVNTWYYISATFDINGDLKIHVYVNGAEVTYFSQVTGTAPAVANDSAANLYWTGQNRGRIHDMKIWNAILTVPEMVYAMKGGHPRGQNCVVWAKMISPGDVNEPDYSGSGNTGVVENTGMFLVAVPPGWSMDFVH